MTPTHLQQWIQHPETLNRDTLYELRTLVARYPYFQSLRLLYLKNLYLLHDINFGAELRKAVLYVADRRVLFYFIEGDRYTLKSRKVSSLFSGDLEKEPSVDRTLSLIDAFLATVPEEHSQHTELDYAVDYTAYLMQEEPGVDAEDESEVPKLRGHELIDDFIQKSESSDASDTRREFLVEKEEETEEEEEPSVSPVTEELDDSCFTETLAKIYVKQQRYSKALEIIKKLSLKYPEKNVYFALCHTLHHYGPLWIIFAYTMYISYISQHYFLIVFCLQRFFPFLLFSLPAFLVFQVPFCSLYLYIVVLHPFITTLL